MTLLTRAPGLICPSCRHRMRDEDPECDRCGWIYDELSNAAPTERDRRIGLDIVNSYRGGRDLEDLTHAIAVAIAGERAGTTERVTLQLKSSGRYDAIDKLRWLMRRLADSAERVADLAGEAGFPGQAAADEASQACEELRAAVVDARAAIR